MGMTEPSASREPGDYPAEPRARTGRWLKVVGIVLALLLLLILAMMLMDGGGGHGPGRHRSGGSGGPSPGITAAVVGSRWGELPPEGGYR